MDYNNVWRQTQTTISYNETPKIFVHRPIPEIFFSLRNWDCQVLVNCVFSRRHFPIPNVLSEENDCLSPNSIQITPLVNCGRGVKKVLSTIDWQPKRQATLVPINQHYH